MQRKYLVAILSVLLIFVLNFSGLTNLDAEISAMNVAAVRVYASDEKAVPDYHFGENQLESVVTGKPIMINALIENQNHSTEHFDLVTEILDSNGVVILLDIRPGVAVPLGDELGIDSSNRPITINETGNYIAKVFTWRNDNGIPEPLAIGSELGFKVTIANCEGKADCITGIVTKVVDGDTLDIDNTRIRLAIVNTPEIGEPGYKEAKQFTAGLCPVGSQAVADEDDGQPEGSYNRVIAKVTCGDKVLNEELLNANLAEVLIKFCGVSEFRDENWAKENGC